jgi:hypothetical protein
MQSQAQRLRRILAVVGAVSLVGTAACAAKVEPTEGQARSQQVEGCGQHRFRSPVKVVIDLAREHGSLTSEQELAIDGIEADLEEQRESFRELHERLRVSAAEVVRAGSAESGELDRAVAEAVDAFEERIEQSNAAVVEIHTMLEPDQRLAVADALRIHIDEKFGPRPERQKKHEDGFKRFASDLLLSSLQVEQLKTIKKELIGEGRDLRPSQEELHALVDAFEGEDFEPAVAEFHAKKSRILRARIARAGERADSVLAIFTAEQRDLLADLILEGPSKVLMGEQAPQQ